MVRCEKGCGEMGKGGWWRCEKGCGEMEKGVW